MTTRTKTLEPRASVLIESMRDIGYSLSTAVADIIDNSLTAKAGRVDLFATTSGAPAIAILDNGEGMTGSRLLEAMRPGTKSPREERPKGDLGRFGLGLKTASFSQCRRLTVLTRRRGKVSCAVWDLDRVAATDEWAVEIPDDTSSVPWADRLKRDGTLVVWERLDRLGDSRGGTDFNRQLDELADHIELVFHRILSGEGGAKGVVMTLNERELRPFDPFHSGHSATQRGPEEVLRLDGERIVIRPFTLPHHKNVSETDWRRYEGPDGYLRSQGFYLYRNRRLIIHGTWFGLARQSELTKLSRVQIDVSNSLDSKWKIDVKKASAQLPLPVRDRLKRLIDRIGASSKRAYSARGARLVSDSRMPVWTRSRRDNAIVYGIDAGHPLLARFFDGLDPAKAKEFRRVIDLVADALPIDSLFADMGDQPQDIGTRRMDDGQFADAVRDAALALRRAGHARKIVEAMMGSSEPFASRWDEARGLLDALDWDEVA